MKSNKLIRIHRNNDSEKLKNFRSDSEARLDRQPLFGKGAPLSVTRHERAAEIEPTQRLNIRKVPAHHHKQNESEVE